MPLPDVLVYREESRVVAEVSGIIDLTDCDAVTRTLRSHVAACEAPELVVRLHDSIVTTAALRAVAAAHTAARERGVRLWVVAPPVAVRIFEAACMDFLLGPEAYDGR
jgi:anti-anti-sigma regulatory factor